MNDVEIIRHLVDPKRRFSLLKDIIVEQGTKDDWELLRELHYKAENLPAGPDHYRATLNGRTICAGVLSNPKMLSRGRNNVMPMMKPNQGGIDGPIINRHRAIHMNNRIRCNSRLVLDTMFRGTGIAYRAQNLMMRLSGAELIEFQSSMSKVNPFAQKAGFRFGQPERSQFYDKGLAWFRRWFVSAPSDHESVMAELNAMRPAVREKCVTEMRRLYFKCSVLEQSGDNRMNGTSRVDKMSVEYLLKSLQQVIFASPLYGLYQNPDYGRQLPAQLPLLAFDNQNVDKPLRLDLLPCN